MFKIKKRIPLEKEVKGESKSNAQMSPMCDMRDVWSITNVPSHCQFRFSYILKNWKRFEAGLHGTVQVGCQGLNLCSMETCRNISAYQCKSNWKKVFGRKNDGPVYGQNCVIHKGCQRSRASHSKVWAEGLVLSARVNLLPCVLMVFSNIWSKKAKGAAANQQKKTIFSFLGLRNLPIPVF